MAKAGAVMIKRFLAWIKGVLDRMLHISETKRTLGKEIAISQPMQEAIDLWEAMFTDKAPWLDESTRSLGLPAAIAGEFARLTTFELESEIAGSARAVWLQGEYNPVLQALRAKTELGCAGGGLVFKPYVENGHIAVDYVPAWRFLPTGFANGKVISAAFVEQIVKGKRVYTRMEHHERTPEGYRIRNLAFRSESEGTLGSPCSLAEVDEWAELEPDVTIRYKDGTVPDRMLFAWFRVPQENNIDVGSPLGVSVFSGATRQIEDADRQYGRAMWEFEGSELAVDASYGALELQDDGRRAKLPRGKQRLFRQLNLDRGTSGDLYEIFSPEIRDQSLFNGLDKILKRIEFNCSLAYGTLSDPQNVDKTAEEIKTSKQRSYATVCEIQKALQTALEDLIWCMDFYATGYKLAPKGEYEVSFTWGDGVLQDVEKEFARRKLLVDAGYMKPEKLISWYFGVSEEEAQEYMPAPERELKLG